MTNLDIRTLVLDALADARVSSTSADMAVRGYDGDLTHEVFSALNEPAMVRFTEALQRGCDSEVLRLNRHLLTPLPVDDSFMIEVRRYLVIYEFTRELRRMAVEYAMTETGEITHKNVSEIDYAL